jgi:two-component system, cell cycle sensor histidine kinase and response regulator CckA
MSNPPTEAACVLVVDDEPANRKLLADMLRREGFAVRVAEGGAEALAELENGAVDLVLLDMMMPEVDGIAVLRRLAAEGRLPALPVVVVTAHDDREAKIAALSAGAMDFLTKPIDRLALTCKVRTLVELKQLRERAVSISEGRRAEADHLLRLNFEQSPVPRIAWDAALRVTAWNPAATRLFGYTEHEAAGRHASFLFPKFTEGEVSSRWRQQAQGEAGSFTEETATRDGRTLLCEWHNAELSTANGAPIGVSSVALNITERARLQSALAQSQKMEAIGRLAGGVAHDFNNVLSVILSFAGFVEEGLPSGHANLDDVREVIKAADRAAGLTRQLLAFSRQAAVAPRPTDLAASLARLHGMLARTLGASVELEVHAGAAPVVVDIDPVQFDQVVLNLAINARDAMAAGGRLEIRLTPLLASGGRGWAQLVVRDNGSGMDPATMQRAFEPYFTTKSAGSGTGLGLATCFAVVSGAEGTIRVESAVGEGTAFTVEFPLSTGELAVPVEVGVAVRPGRGEVVLVVEDDAAVRKGAVRVLRQAGYLVHEAADGRAGREQLAALAPSLSVLVSDVDLPYVNGLELARLAGTLAPTAGVVLMSGFLSEALQAEIGSTSGLLWKPVHANDLVRAVAAAAAPPRAPQPASVPPSVLVVEDEPELRELLVDILVGAGFVSTGVATEGEARRAIEAGPFPDAIITDLNLAEGSCAGLLDWLERSHADAGARVLVLTGGARDAVGRRITEGGQYRVVHKPVRPRQLLQALLELGLSGTVAAPGPAPEAVPLPPTVPAAVPAATPGAVRRPRLLFVDDDAALAAVAHRVLDPEFEVVAAGSLAEARAALARGAFEVIFVDLGLPDGSGTDLLPDVGDRDPRPPVVMMTASLSAETAPLALRARVSEYLPKPFSAAQLRVAARSAVESVRIQGLRAQWLASRFGGDEFVRDLRATEREFEMALPRVRVHFQPIVRARGGEVYGFEALLRCDNPLLGTPLRLLAAAELLGRVEEVGRAVRACVAGALSAHPDRSEVIFVNIHPEELRVELLGAADDPLLAYADRVVLEITERASVGGRAGLDQEIEGLRKLGYRLAIDDLGEGYAGLASLVQLYPDVAKIDMSLVRDVHRMPLKRDLVRALVEMAGRSGIAVVAEGVETELERDALVELGCDLLQGYLFGRPAPGFPPCAS